MKYVFVVTKKPLHQSEWIPSQIEKAFECKKDADAYVKEKNRNAIELYRETRKIKLEESK